MFNDKHVCFTHVMQEHGVVSGNVQQAKGDRKGEAKELQRNEVSTTNACLAEKRLWTYVQITSIEAEEGRCEVTKVGVDDGAGTAGASETSGGSQANGA